VTGTLLPRTSSRDPVGCLTIVVHAQFRCGPRANECRSQYQMDELRRRLVVPGGFDFETRWRLPASCGLVGQ
jgi:hypothetical protein